MEVIMNKIYNQKSKAFTLIEMLVVAPIIILIIGLIMNLMIRMTGEVIATRSAASITYDIQDALDTIENDVVNSGAFLATNNISLTSPQGRNNDVTPFQNASDTYGPAIILNSYGTTENPLKSELEYIYTKSPNPCSSSLVGANPRLMFNTVYFIKDNALWRRVIATDNYAVAGCKTPWQIPSCYPGVSGSICKGQDKKMVDGVTISGLEINYYPSPNSTTPDSIATDAAQTDSARQTALTANSTISVKITSNLTVAGRNITQIGTIRASSKNDYTVATPQKPVVITHPSDASKLDNETNVTFTVNSFGSNYIQWQEYNGTTWNDIAGSNYSGVTSSTLTIATINNLMDGYLYRAMLTNNGGTTYSDSARLSVGDATWKPLTLLNGWINYGGGYNNAEYRKTRSGVVILRGLIKSGTATTGTHIGILPKGYRPIGGKELFTINKNPNVKGRVDVRSDDGTSEAGAVVCINCDASWTSLEGIHFIPNNGRYPNISLTPLNSWTNYGSGHMPASYSVDDIGRVHLQGFLKPENVAATTAGTIIYKMPNNLLPSEYMHFPAYTYYVNTHLSLEPAVGGEGVQSKIQQSTLEAVPTQLAYYPANKDSNWINLSLAPNWSYYSNPFTKPQYIKGSDGLVSLKGLIKYSGTPGYDTTIATLPVGFRPSGRVLHNGVASSGYTRTDILSTGEIRFMTGSSAWTSLDGITFYADQ